MRLRDRKVFQSHFLFSELVQELGWKWEIQYLPTLRPLILIYASGS